MEYWIARDNDNGLYLYGGEPTREGEEEWFSLNGAEGIEIDREHADAKTLPKGKKRRVTLAFIDNPYLQSEYVRRLLGGTNGVNDEPRPE